MKNKITSKNKNIINIKINTAKKEKSKRRKRESSNKGNSSYNLSPPIIIQPQQPVIFPQYNPHSNFINSHTRENNQLFNNPTAIAEPYHIPIAQTVNSSSYINPTSTTSIPIAQSLPRKYRFSIPQNENFINDTSTHPIPISQAIEEEAFEKFHSPLKNTDSSSNLNTIQNYYDGNSEDDEAQFTNPMKTVKEIEKSYFSGGQSPPKSKKQNGVLMGDERPPIAQPEILDLVSKKRKEKNEMSKANYHSKAQDYSVENYNSLLEKLNSLNPNEKPDGDFANKKPSKSLYAKLVGKINKLERKKPIEQHEEPNIPIPPTPVPQHNKKQKRKVFIHKMNPSSMT